jgi:hypothetical protein
MWSRFNRNERFKQMNIVFAYHNGDADLAMESAKAITAMGLNIRHKAYVCTRQGTKDCNAITQELKKSFPEVEQLIVQDGFEGWPLGPNQMFSDVAAAMYPTGVPFYFWEPDCVPMKEKWVDDLDAEYHRKVGIIGHLYEGGVASNGKNIYKMIVGSAVYPPNFLDFCPSAQSLSTYNMAYKSAGSIPEPWDVRCRWNFLAIGRDTPLIRTYWKSVNYQWKDGKIVFYAADPEAQGVQEVTCPDRVISSQAVVIHGCKDGSLHKMAQEGFPMPSDSMGLEGGGQIAPPLVQSVNNEAQSPTVCNNTTDKVPNNVETVTDDELSPESCNNSSDKADYAPYPIQVLCEAVGLTTRENRLLAVKQDAPKAKKNPSPKAKKKRVISEAERERRRQSMLAILQRKRERKAQAAV